MPRPTESRRASARMHREDQPLGAQGRHGQRRCPGLTQPCPTPRPPPYRAPPPAPACPPAWFPVHDLPSLAFHNDRVIDYALRRLRAKLDYSNVAYSLLPAQFTLSQLQHAYEAILDRPQDERG